MAVTESVGRMHMGNREYKEESTEGIFILNARGDFVHLNEKALAFMEKSRSQLEGKPFTSIIPGREKRKIYSSSLLEGKGIRYMITKHRYGRRLAFEVDVNPIMQDGKIIMFVGTIRDITHVEEMEAEAKRAFYREKVFRENVSHHFFNPLVIARGYIQLVMDGMPESDEKRRLEAAKRALGRIESVVKNVIKNGDIRE